MAQDATEGEIQIVEAYRTEFSDDEFDNLPQFDYVSHLFRVIRAGKVAHQLSIGRAFLEDHSQPGQLEAALRDPRIANRMREAGAEPVFLRTSQ